jgi:predicted metal-dependent phosphoesterase TrpH
MFIDLHTHTTASDGTLTPTQLVELARQNDLKAIAVTDHDTIDGVAEAQRAGERLGVEVVPGIEISGIWPSGTLHILGYLVDIGSPALTATLKTFRGARDDRNPKILAKLNALGMPLDMEEVRARAGGSVVGRPHIAQAMIARGYVKTVREAFDKYLGDNGAAFVDKELVPPADAIAMIHEAGGLAVLAHPRWLKWQDERELDWFVMKLKHDGIDGIECYHSDHDRSDEEMYERFARRYDLLITGGSDFHGHAKVDIHLGRGRGSLRVPYEVLERLKAEKRRRAEKERAKAAASPAAD